MGKAAFPRDWLPITAEAPIALLEKLIAKRIKILFPTRLKVVGLFACSMLGCPGNLALAELAAPASLGLCSFP